MVRFWKARIYFILHVLNFQECITDDCFLEAVAGNVPQQIESFIRIATKGSIAKTGDVISMIRLMPGLKRHVMQQYVASSFLDYCGSSPILLGGAIQVV